MSAPAPLIAAALAPLWAVITALVLIGLFVLYRVSAKYAFKNLSYSREFSQENVFEGEEIVLTETIVNNTPFPIFGVEAEAYIYRELEFKAYIPDIDKNMQYVLSRFTLMPRMKIRRRHVLICRKRGFYRIETANLWHGKKNAFFECPAEVYVFPKMMDSGINPSPLSFLQGGSVAARRVIPDPFSFSGIRDYRFGDPFSSINFKATAKAPITGYSSIKVNNCDFCAARNVMIFVNFQTDTESDPIPTPVYTSLMELALSYSASLISEAMEQGYRAGFAANCPDVRTASDMRFKMNSGREHMIDILRGLACVRVGVGGSFLHLIEREIAENITDAEFYIMTTYISPGISDRISALELLGNTVNVIEFGRDFPASGREEAV